MQNHFDKARFLEMPIVGILRNISTSSIRKIAPLYEKSGLRNLEITMNSPNALENIAELVASYPQLSIGAGTVCTTAEMDAAVAAGASFIVCPIMNLDLIRKAASQGLGIFPGALSPTEIYAAWEAGATAVKVFPASTFGPSYLKEVRGPLSQIDLLPTGGVSKDNLADYFEAGAIGAGMGSSLFEREALKSNDDERLYKHFTAIYDLVMSYRSRKVK